MIKWNAKSRPILRNVIAHTLVAPGKVSAANASLITSSNKELPACCFSKEIEKTYNRSFERFAESVSSKK